MMFHGMKGLGDSVNNYVSAYNPSAMENYMVNKSNAVPQYCDVNGTSVPYAQSGGCPSGQVAEYTTSQTAQDPGFAAANAAYIATLRPTSWVNPNVTYAATTPQSVINQAVAGTVAPQTANNTLAPVATAPALLTSQAISNAPHMTAGVSTAPALVSASGGTAPASVPASTDIMLGSFDLTQNWFYVAAGAVVLFMLMGKK